MRRRHRVALAALVGVGFLLATASAASAHANLVSTVPSQSARFPAGSPPRNVSVTFDEDVHATPTSLTVYDGAGKDVGGRSGTGSRTGKRIDAALPKLPEGTYVVVWHVVSDDGHPEHGAFTFVVGRGGATQADIGKLVASRSSGRGIGLLFGIDRAIVFLGSLVLAGGLLFVSWRWPAALEWPEVRGFLADAGVLAIVATAASIPLQAAYTSLATTDVLSERFGRAALVRVAVLAALVVGARRAKVSVAVVVAAAAVVTGTFAYAGHGFTGPWPAGAFVVDVVHLGAAALWLGGLAVLVVVLWGKRRRDVAGDGAVRFSQVALPAIGLVVASGLIQGWRQVHGWSALWDTDYARLLIVKALVVVAIVVVASAARDALRDRLELTDVRHGVAIELALAVVVVGVTASLVVSAPAREAEAAASRPTATTLRTSAQGARTDFAVVVQPGLVGDNTVVVSPRLTGGGYLPAALDGIARAGSTQTTITFTPLPDGRWISVAPLTKRGPWTIELTGSTGPSTDKASALVRIN